MAIHPERFPTTEHYPFSLGMIQTAGTLTFDTPVTFFCGENGTGKSTLLDALARKCGIHIWGEIYRSRVGKSPYEKDLYRTLDISWFEGSVPGSYFDSQLFRTFAALLDEWAVADPGILEKFGGRPLLTQSHGQSLMAYFTSRYKLKGLYFLDEPETALSPSTQLELLRLIEEMSGAGHAQFIIASHSPMLLSCDGAKIYHFTNDRVATIEYEQTEHYQVYRDFFREYERNKQ
jgi:predicted ATPase